MNSIAEGSQYTQLCSFVTITCYQCGIPFGVPDYFRAKRLQDKESFFCPNGHSQAYVESESDRLKKQIASEKANTEYYRQIAETRGKQRDHARLQTRALKGVVTKVKKRVGNGVCPCCQRTFQSLARHMQAKHPEYAKQEISQ